MSTDLQTVPPTDAKLSQWVLRPEVQAQVVGAVGDVMNPETFIAHALVAFQDEKIRHCSPASKLKALFEMAALTLLPTLNQCVLLPYNVKVKDAQGREHTVPEIKLTPQWQGYKAVMERHPSVLEVQAHLVHVLDGFLVTNGVPEHLYDPYDPKRLFRGAKDIRGGYSKVTYTDGRPPRYHYSSVAYIEKCRHCAKTDKIWSAWYEKMARKTCYRDCYSSRIAPVDPLVVSHMERIIAADDAILGNDPVRIAQLPSGNERLKAALKKEAPDDGLPVETQPETPAAGQATSQAAAAEDGGSGNLAQSDVAGAEQQDDIRSPDDEALALSDQRREEYGAIVPDLADAKQLDRLAADAKTDAVLNGKDRLFVLGAIKAKQDKLEKPKGKGGTQKNFA